MRLFPLIFLLQVIEVKAQSFFGQELDPENFEIILDINTDGVTVEHVFSKEMPDLRNSSVLPALGLDTDSRLSANRWLVISVDRVSPWCEQEMERGRCR